MLHFPLALGFFACTEILGKRQSPYNNDDADDKYIHINEYIHIYILLVCRLIVTGTHKIFVVSYSPTHIIMVDAAT